MSKKRSLDANDDILDGKPPPPKRRKIDANKSDKDQNNSNILVSIPTDILGVCLCFLTGNDVLNVEITCKTLNTVIRNSTNCYYSFKISCRKPSKLENKSKFKNIRQLIMDLPSMNTNEQRSLKNFVSFLPPSKVSKLSELVIICDGYINYTGNYEEKSIYSELHSCMHSLQTIKYKFNPKKVWNPYENIYHMMLTLTANMNILNNNNYNINCLDLFDTRFQIVSSSCRDSVSAAILSLIENSNRYQCKVESLILPQTKNIIDAADCYYKDLCIIQTQLILARCTKSLKKLYCPLETLLYHTWYDGLYDDLQYQLYDVNSDMFYPEKDENGIPILNYGKYYNWMFECPPTNLKDITIEIDVNNSEIFWNEIKTTLVPFICNDLQKLSIHMTSISCSLPDTILKDIEMHLMDTTNNLQSFELVLCAPRDKLLVQEAVKVVEILKTYVNWKCTNSKDGFEFGVVVQYAQNDEVTKYFQKWFKLLTIKLKKQRSGNIGKKRRRLNH